jgi:exodeoxyribonuclease VII large subunit
MVAEAPVPVVTGVGHETDFTIVDFVADLRAPTPSAAAAAVTPDVAEYRRLLAGFQQRLADLAIAAIDERRRFVERLQATLRQQAPLYRIDQQRLMVDDLARRLSASLTHRLQRHRLEVDALSQRLAALNPNAVLSRGYAIVQDEEGHVIDQVKQTYPGQGLNITVSDGAFRARVEEETLD